MRLRETSNAFLLTKFVALETFVQCFRFKLLNDILFLDSRSVETRFINSDLCLCTFCQSSQETLEHFFFDCESSRYWFWIKFENSWFRVTKEQKKLDYGNIILGILDQKKDLLNYFIILGKLYLCRSCRKKNRIPLFAFFEAIVKDKYNTEKLIAYRSKLS